MVDRSIVLRRVGNFYGTYPTEVYFYMKIVGDFPNRNTTRNVAFLLANILMDNRKWIDWVYDIHTGFMGRSYEVGFQSFVKWIRNYG